VATKDESSKKNTTAKSKTKRVRKPKESLRERNVKASENKGKQKRARRVASATVDTSKKVGSALTTEFHLTEQKENPGFFTKSRTLTPKYFRNSWKEIKLVTWPDFKTTWKLVFAVFVFSIIVGGFIALLDYGLEKAFREIIL
jgi:preprotein translocase SecE subunit